MSIKSFSLVATAPCHKEADILIWSIRNFYDQPILVVCDDITAEHLRSKGHKDLFFKTEANQEDLEALNLSRVETKNSFHQKGPIFKKMEAITWATKNFENTMFVDSDIVFLQKIDGDLTNSVMLSRITTQIYENQRCGSMDVITQAMFSHRKKKWGRCGSRYI